MQDRIIALDIKEIRNIYNGQPLRHPWESVRLGFVCSQINAIIKNKRFRRLMVLDFGAGDAFIGKELAATYRESRIICIDNEYNDDLINALSGPSSDMDVSFYSNLEAVEDPTFKANVVLMLDVFEHMENDVEALRHLLKSCAIDDSAVFIITVPAFQSLFSSHDEILHHYRRYKLSDLAGIAKEAELKVVAKGYLFLSLLLVRFCQVILEHMGLKPPARGSAVSNWQGGRILTCLVVLILRLDMKLSRLFSMLKIPFIGLTAFIICENNNSNPLL